MAELRKFKIGDEVIINEAGRTQGHKAVVEGYMEQYPDKKWYWLRLDTPITNALAVDEFPHNATHDAIMERDLQAV